MKGGKNNRRGKKEDGENKRELVFKEDGQGSKDAWKRKIRSQMPGWRKSSGSDPRSDEEEGVLPTAFLKQSLQDAHSPGTQVWIVVGDIILLSLRDFQDDRADVIHRYTPDEARNLKTYGELKDFQLVEGQEGAVSDGEEGGVEFEEADIDDICKRL
nr:translation initiation factor eIF-1A [Cryptococcus depauperatus CBS 7841]ODN90297.1 translation initiation factor eIF-1A [Cryptococcus depauperatus CBS 7855]